ncbi:MAG: hypothetical protein MI799_20975 [Desulfobacterales bacterium]|nr:hypothetical protein [Desulfobacterales bacterium]
MGLPDFLNPADTAAQGVVANSRFYDFIGKVFKQYFKGFFRTGLSLPEPRQNQKKGLLWIVPVQLNMENGCFPMYIYDVPNRENMLSWRHSGFHVYIGDRIMVEKHRGYRGKPKPKLPPHLRRVHVNARTQKWMLDELKSRGWDNVGIYFD